MKTNPHLAYSTRFDSTSTDKCFQNCAPYQNHTSKLGPRLRFVVKFSIRFSGECFHFSFVALDIGRFFQSTTNACELRKRSKRFLCIKRWPARDEELFIWWEPSTWCCSASCTSSDGRPWTWWGEARWMRFHWHRGWSHKLRCLGIAQQLVT